MILEDKKYAKAYLFGVIKKESKELSNLQGSDESKIIKKLYLLKKYYDLLNNNERLVEINKLCKEQLECEEEFRYKKMKVSDAIYDLSVLDEKKGIKYCANYQKDLNKILKTNDKFAIERFFYDILYTEIMIAFKNENILRLERIKGSYLLNFGDLNITSFYNSFSNERLCFITEKQLKKIEEIEKPFLIQDRLKNKLKELVLEKIEEIKTTSPKLKKIITELNFYENKLIKINRNIEKFLLEEKENINF